MSDEKDRELEALRERVKRLEETVERLRKRLEWEEGEVDLRDQYPSLPFD